MSFLNYMSDSQHATALAHMQAHPGMSYADAAIETDGHIGLEDQLNESERLLYKEAGKRAELGKLVQRVEGLEEECRRGEESFNLEPPPAPPADDLRARAALVAERLIAIRAAREDAERQGKAPNVYTPADIKAQTYMLQNPGTTYAAARYRVYRAGQRG